MGPFDVRAVDSAQPHLAPRLPMSQSGNPAAPFTLAVFIAGCISGAGVVTSCELRATEPGECGSAYLTGLGLVVMGSVPKTANDVGFQTLNPALDGMRKARLQEEAELEAATEGPPVDLPPEPDWLAMDAHPVEPVVAEVVVPVWVDDAIAAPVEPPAPELTAAQRMARAAARLPREAKG
jgi:hypothetical protein